MACFGSSVSGGLYNLADFCKIILLPTTEVLLTHKDRDTGNALIDLVATEEFLASHVLRVGEAGPSEGNKDAGSVRDNRGKAKQFTTVNGRTVVVKESFVYSNKGKPGCSDIVERWINMVV